MFHVWNIQGLQRTYVPGAQIPEIGRIGRSAAVGAGTDSNTGNQSPEYKAALAHYEEAAKVEPRQAICASDIMTKPVVSIPVAATVAQVSEMMTARRFRHLPVVDDTGAPVGIVSDRDVLRRAVAALQDGTDLSAVPVSRIMAKELLSALPEAEIRDVAKVMFDEHVGAIPIISQERVLLGIITRSDILRALLKHGPLTLWV